MSHDWDARYDSAAQVWSGRPNQALVVEAADWAPGTALDVGCGEGADAVWLAGRGWRVTGLDPSSVALGRAAGAAAAAGVSVAWVHGILDEADLPTGAFDLVLVAYPALDLDSDPMDTLTALVAPGGTLLVLMHAHIDREKALAHGFDPDRLLGADAVRSGLPSGWRLEVDAVRERRVDGGAGAEHTHDVVLRAVSP